jgi:DNA-binding NarL/FixJ family response regulator
MLLNHAKILLVEDHPLYREALVNELRQFLPTAQLLPTATITETFRLIQQQHSFTLALLDLNLPDSDGLNSLLAIHQLLPAVPIAVISANENTDLRDSALQLGADVFINKSASTGEIREAITRLIDPELGDITSDNATAPIALTVRQQQVLFLLAQGKSNKEIAITMELADTTVRDHVTEILRRLDAGNRTEAVVKAQQLGLLG